jgi:hypothetical protein
MTGLAARGSDGRELLAALSPPPRHGHGHGRWSTAARVRTQAAAIVALACCLAALTAVLLGQVGGEFHAMGQQDAPEADATTGLYFDLNDMDAQVANVLLVGGDTALAASRSQDLATYSSDRTAADQDLEQATVAEADNAAAERQLSQVLDRTSQYEALAADALLASQQARSTAGRAPAAAVTYYQQATDLMQAGILPAVGSLANVSAARLDAAYQGGKTAGGIGTAWAIALGVVLIAALLALQLYLAARFQRLVNPALAAATVIAIAFVAVTAVRFNTESGHLQVAKQDAFDSIQALSLARAVSYDANADESRYLVDPGRAAQYQQAFLSKSQQIANVGPVGISGYDAALAADIKAYQGDNSVVRFGGYLGAEFRNITFPGERQAAVATLLAFQRYERDDRTLRALAAKNLPAVVGYDTGTAPSQSDGAFNQYDAALSSVIAVNSRAFTAAVADGEDGAVGWELGLPALGLVLLAALTFAAVRPRLAEYR